MDKTPLESRNLVLRVSEYAINKDLFQMKAMIKELDLDQYEIRFIQTQMLSSPASPNYMFDLSSYDQHNEWDLCYYRIVPNAVFNYVDYLEIKEARINAREAKLQSSLALMIAVGSLVIGTFVGLLGIITQLVFSK